MPNIIGPALPPEMQLSREREARAVVVGVKNRLNDKMRECKEGGHFNATLPDVISTGRIATQGANEMFGASSQESLQHVFQRFHERSQELASERGPLAVREGHLRGLLSGTFKLGYKLEDPASDKTTLAVNLRALEAAHSYPVTIASGVSDGQHAPAVVELAQLGDQYREAAIALGRLRLQAHSLR